ncbi:MAG: pilus assembly protein [Holosporaceae bacterium]|nr:pilus assembly protein [Holosporaceae bacterium]
MMNALQREKKPQFRINFGGPRGSIMVEFAFSIPVLLIILYYVLDYPNYARMKLKTKNSALMAISMIQNVSKNRENKRISLEDVKRINYSAFINYYSGQQQLTKADTLPLGHLPITVLIYVKGTGNNYCKVVWSLFVSGENATSPIGSGGSLDEKNTSSSELTIADFRTWTGKSYQHGQDLASTSLHPDLKIQINEIKMLLMTAFFTKKEFKYADQKNVSDNPRKLFGFHMLPLQLPLSGDNILFRNTVTFIPNPGLFSDDPPK